MDASLYKDIVNSRGLKYHYYVSPAKSSKRTLLFCHGVPSTAREWKSIVAHFVQDGYGVIAVDMLGLGETDKPTDPAAYVSSLVTRDIIDILDAEKVERVVAIGHHWGSKIVGRLSNYYPERVTAYAFLAMPYLGIRPEMELRARQSAGYEAFGYWAFLAEEGAAKIIGDNLESFHCIAYPSDPIFYKERLAPTGAFKKNLLEGFSAPLPSYLTEEDKQHCLDMLRRGPGLAAPICWYNIMTNHMSDIDDQQILPKRTYPPVNAPIFFGVGTLDYICTAALGNAEFNKPAWSGHTITKREYHGDHWFILSKADELTKDLQDWIDGFALSV